ncbi:uncharacterized protein LOC111712403 isoform X1 [Eurytemora carolleeae]|uniref:uncharacterized protein LOC111712403 isoform X1 n=1 Tax=Eurytemora carolleeae TaxID=1294199 RepID=UPI000C793255|nr:uncharacterized protein LOC111712403 isoform X1 [Eurytemora carolleeae]|eukprot:XP_023342766.1 uncharacterized protein LOC111712403 isoform X1 [Eurytemora affinis]
MKTTLLVLFFISTIGYTLSLQCCPAQEVAVYDGDVRCGTYLLHKKYTNTTNNASAVEAGCHDGCIYTKMNDRSGALYCFGNGDLTSFCLPDSSPRSRFGVDY